MQPLLSHKTSMQIVEHIAYHQQRQLVKCKLYLSLLLQVGYLPGCTHAITTYIRVFVIRATP